MKVYLNKRLKHNNTDYLKKYGMSAKEISKKFKVAISSLSIWDGKGLNALEKAECSKIFRSSKGKLTQLWGNMRFRCNSPKDTSFAYYGGKGIKVLITKYELAKLWIRDEAFKMKKPSIDRIDSNKDYTFENCRFIEHRLNCHFARWNKGKYQNALDFFKTK